MLLLLALRHLLKEYCLELKGFYYVWSSFLASQVASVIDILRIKDVKKAVAELG